MTCTSAPLAISRGSRRWATVPPPTTMTFLPASRNPTSRSSRSPAKSSVDCQGGRQAGRSRSAPSDPCRLPGGRQAGRSRSAPSDRVTQPADYRAQASRRVMQAGAAPQHRDVRNAVVEEIFSITNNPCWAYMSARYVCALIRHGYWPTSARAARSSRVVWPCPRALRLVHSRPIGIPSGRRRALPSAAACRSPRRHDFPAKSAGFGEQVAAVQLRIRIACSTTNTRPAASAVRKGFERQGLWPTCGAMLHSRAPLSPVAGAAHDAPAAASCCPMSTLRRTAQAP